MSEGVVCKVCDKVRQGTEQAQRNPHEGDHEVGSASVGDGGEASVGEEKYGAGCEGDSRGDEYVEHGAVMEVEGGDNA